MVLAAVVNTLVPTKIYRQVNSPNGFVKTFGLRADNHVPVREVISEVFIQYVQPQLSAYLWALGTSGYEHAVLMRIASEESGYDVLAANNAFHGIYQYGPVTWVDNGCNTYGVYAEWHASAQCALQDWRRGMAHQWQVTWFW